MITLLDTHQHLIYRAQAGYSWTADIPALAVGDFTVGDYHKLTSHLGVEGSLFMETGVDDADYQNEARYISELASNPDSEIRGIIASIRPEFAQGFDYWLERAAELGAVGFRRILHVVDDDMSRSAIFRRNIDKIGAAGKPFDICFLARQLPIAIELAKTCENTLLILNHCGVPDIAGGQTDPWRGHMQELAALPNVYCKLSGILAYCAPGEASYQTIEPYVDHVLNAFGSDRIVWGSDWPVVNLGGGIAEWIEVTRRILEQLSETEAQRIAHLNARDIYRVD